MGRIFLQIHRKLIVIKREDFNPILSQYWFVDLEVRLDQLLPYLQVGLLLKNTGKINLALGHFQDRLVDAIEDFMLDRMEH